MAILVPAVLKLEVLIGALTESLTGPSSGWASQRVLDMMPGHVPEWVLVEGTEVIPEEVPESEPLFEATSCNPGATLEYPRLESPPSRIQSRHKCLVS